jgi:hypothetical protein
MFIWMFCSGMELFPPILYVDKQKQKLYCSPSHSHYMEHDAHLTKLGKLDKHLQCGGDRDRDRDRIKSPSKPNTQ